MTASSVKMVVAMSEVEERPDSWLGTVTISDEEYVNLAVIYEYLVKRSVEQLLLHSFRLEPTQAAIDGAELFRLAPAVIRDMPLARWDRLARLAVRRSAYRAISQPDDLDVDTETSDGRINLKDAAYHLALDPSGGEVTPEERKEFVESAVSRLKPNLDPSQGKGAQRTWRSLIRYVEVYMQYGDLLLQGSADPVAVIAEAHGVEKATVRSWLHRAREAGIPDVMLQMGAPGGGERGVRPVGADDSASGDVWAGLAEWWAEQNDAAELRKIGLELMTARLNLRGDLFISEERLARNLGTTTETIEAIERGDFRGMEKARGRGYVRLYAAYVRLDAAKIADRYDRAFGITPGSHRRGRGRKGE